MVAGYKFAPSDMAADSLTRDPGAELQGRQRERAVLDRLIEAVRREESQALVLRGEPEVGKTALLEYLVARASGCRVVRPTGVPSEMELAFAGLQQLVAPMLDGVETVPAPQHDAVLTAFGIRTGPAPDLPARLGRPQSARRCRREATAHLRGRRRTMARSGVRAHAGVRGATPGCGVGGAALRGTDAWRGAGRAAGARGAGAA